MAERGKQRAVSCSEAGSMSEGVGCCQVDAIITIDPGRTSNRGYFKIQAGSDPLHARGHIRFSIRLSFWTILIATAAEDAQ